MLLQRSDGIYLYPIQRDRLDLSAESIQQIATQWDIDTVNNIHSSHLFYERSETVSKISFFLIVPEVSPGVFNNSAFTVSGGLPAGIVQQ